MAVVVFVGPRSGARTVGRVCAVVPYVPRACWESSVLVFVDVAGVWVLVLERIIERIIAPAAAHGARTRSTATVNGRNVVPGAAQKKSGRADGSGILLERHLHARTTVVS